MAGEQGEAQQQSTNSESRREQQVGYLQAMHFEGGYQEKSLPKEFSWTDIPMFAVITGKNGVGKTAVLEAILKGAERTIGKQAQFKINLQLHDGPDGNMQAGYIPHVLGISSATSDGQIRASTVKYSEKAYNEDVEETFNDLLAYEIAKREGIKHQTNYPNLQSWYDEILASFKEWYNPQIQLIDANFYYNRNRALKQYLEKEIGVHLTTFGNIDNLIKFLLVARRIALAKINQYLIANNFKYVVSQTSYNLEKVDSPEQFKQLALRDWNNGHIVDPGWMSPGERLQLLALLWIYASNLLMDNGDNGRILLLDEIDAHLHPSLAKEVIDVIRYKLVEEMQVQIIMTTHSPTTVSLVPAESLYIMSEDSTNKKAIIQKASSKRQAIKLLAADFVCINQPIRLIFVEADSDKQFYEIIYNHLTHRGVLAHEYQLLFKSHGKVRKSEVDEKIGTVTEDSSRKQVENLVEKCVVNDDEDKTLSDFMFGLVDGDNRGRSKQKNIQALQRYSLENYLYDPIHIFILLNNIKAEKDGRLKENNCIDEFKHILTSLNQLVKQKISSDEPESLLPEMIDLQLLNSSQLILQAIIDAVFEDIAEFINQLITKFDTDKSKIKRSERQIIYRLKANKKIYDGKLSLEKEDVQLHNEVVLEYPKLFLYMRGHDLAEIYTAKYVAMSVDDLMRLCKKDMLICQELVDIFRTFQSPDQTLNTTDSKQHKKRKATDNSDKQKAQLEQIKCLEKKTSGQTKELKRRDEIIQRRNGEIASLNAEITRQQGIISKFFRLPQFKTLGISHECEYRNELLDSGKVVVDEKLFTRKSNG